MAEITLMDSNGNVTTTEVKISDIPSHLAAHAASAGFTILRSVVKE